MGNGVAGAGFASPSVGGAGAIAFDIGSPLAYAGTLNNTGGFVKSGSAQLNWNSTGNQMTGTIEVAAGTLSVGNGVWNNGVFNSGAGRTWQVDSGAALALGTFSATNSDNYIINGGAEPYQHARPQLRQLFHFSRHDRRHDQRRLAAPAIKA